MTGTTRAVKENGMYNPGILLPGISFDKKLLDLLDNPDYGTTISESDTYNLESDMTDGTVTFRKYICN